jgi:transcriptional regulator with XRE-family HTH domain
MPRSSSRNPDKDPAATLGKHLRRVRMAAGFRTQDALAVRLNVSSDLVSKIETGWHVPTEDIFLAWLETCGVGEEGRILINDMWILARNNRGGFPEFFEKYVTAEEQATFLRLYCLVGTAEVMAGQLEHLLEVSQRHNVIVQVVLGRGASRG